MKNPYFHKCTNLLSEKFSLKTHSYITRIAKKLLILGKKNIDYKDKN